MESLLDCKVITAIFSNVEPAYLEKMAPLPYLSVKQSGRFASKPRIQNIFHMRRSAEQKTDPSMLDHVGDQEGKRRQLGSCSLPLEEHLQLSHGLALSSPPAIRLTDLQDVISPRQNLHDSHVQHDKLSPGCTIR